jgi:hypothetical protein
MDPRQPGFDEMSERVAEDVSELAHAARERSADVVRSVGAFIDEHPLASVGIAFGVGYVLSGALFSRATMRVLGLGGRVAIGGLLKTMMAGGGLGFLAPVLHDVASGPSTEE